MRRNTIKLFVLVTLLAGCSNIRISNNIGDWVETEVKAGSVETYSYLEITSYNAKYLASLSEEYCHAERLAPVPSFAALERKLKAETKDLGGNALVMEPCEKLSLYQSCTTLLRCTATAYVINFDGV